MAISKELLEILACPLCKEDIIYDEKNQKLICTKCGRKYPIKDDIPIMLVEEAELPEETRKATDEHRKGVRDKG